MTEKEAWEFLRKSFRDRNLVETDGLVESYYLIEGDYRELRHQGLCDCVLYLYYAAMITRQQANRMMDKIRRAVMDKMGLTYESAAYNYLYPSTYYGARKRREFCTKMIQELGE